MTKGRRALIIYLLLASVAASVCAQDLANPKSISDLEILGQAELEIQLVLSGQTMRQADLAISANRRLTEILKRNPSSPLRSRIEADLVPVQEILGKHDLEIATFYLNREHGSTRGAESRLKKIVEEFPNFSQMDKVLFQLSSIALRDDRVDDARTYLWKLICKYPSSDQVVPAFERLQGWGFGAWEGCDKAIKH